MTNVSTYNFVKEIRDVDANMPAEIHVCTIKNNSNLKGNTYCS